MDELEKIYVDKNVLIELVKSQYDYSSCSICHKPIEGADVDESVCSEWRDGKMLIAHKSCFQGANPDWKPRE